MHTRYSLKQHLSPRIRRFFGQSATNDRHLVVVLGMHRSGTSAIARSLQLLGIHLGTNLLGGAADNNEKGFFEDLDIVNFNDVLLTALGGHWHSLSHCPTTTQCLGTLVMQQLHEQAIALLEQKMTTADWVGIKDPRIARLLPFWKKVFATLNIDIRYLLAIRNPLSVAASLRRRDGFTEAKSHYLWLQHVIPSVLETRGSQRAVLDFDRLMNNPEPEIRRFALELGLADRLDEAALDDYCSSFLETRLRHSNFDLQDLEHAPAIPRLAVDAFATLSRVGAGNAPIDSEEVTARFCEFSDELERLRPALHLIAELEKLNTERAEQIRVITQTMLERDLKIDFLNIERSALLHSTSWRITKLLRLAMRSLRRQPPYK